MSKDFCEKGYNRADINTAVKQEEHLSYLINSDLEDTELTSTYIRQWAERHYQTSDHFLNYIKSIFKTNNFLLFAKFLRKPLPSAKIVNTKIKPQLERVFFAEDAESQYTVLGVKDSEFTETLDAEEFNQQVFEAYFTAHNSIVITQPSEEVNTPFRYLIRIKSVRSITEDRKGNIDRIAFKTTLEINDKKEHGMLYVDSEKYIFYPFDEKIPPIEAPHDLGYCPAHFISPKKYNGSFVIRESIFTYVREELEDYNVLKTLLKMVMPKGVIPITTKLKPKENNKSEDKKIADPTTDQLMGGQRPEDLFNTNPPKGDGVLDAGSIYNIKPHEKPDGSIDMDVVTNYIKFHYLPVEPLEFLTSEIDKREKSIISSLVGDLVESAEQSKNMLQIERSNAVLDNTLSSLAKSISKVRENSDMDMLNVIYGSDRVANVFISLGTDFMIDSISMLTESYEKAPNTIERENIIRRINRNRYKNNPYKQSRNEILLDIIPFVSDKDFDKAKELMIVDGEMMILQTQFNYWTSRFEAIYGDIVDFYNNIEMMKGERTQFIKDLILNIINNESSTLKTLQSNRSGSEGGSNLPE